MENKGDNTGDVEDEMWHHCTLVGESAVGQAPRHGVLAWREVSEFAIEVP